ncbi:MAG: hypothetical protein RLN75_03000 [Longimicrobiales bacterium]
MANVDEKVMAQVERELEKNPDLGSSDLFEKMKAKYPSIGELSVRQFHARYPLQVKRRKSAASGSTGTRKKKSSKKTSARKGGRKRSAATKSAAKKGATKAPRTRRRSARPAAPRDRREAVRATLMRFATELASAEAKAEVGKVLAGADRYVDEVIEAAGS